MSQAINLTSGKGDPKINGLIRIIFWSVIFITIGFNLCQTLFEIRAFWIDEQSVLDNLKFKEGKELFGTLDHLQQFPRVYLYIIRSFAAHFHFSYTSLRFIPFLVQTAAILLLVRVSRLIYTNDASRQFLLVLLFVSFHVTLHYYVQVKQYGMELLGSVVALWQFHQVYRWSGRFRYPVFFLLALSFFVFPFFSYTYPMAVAPVCLLLIISLFSNSKNGNVLSLLTLLFCLGIGIVLAYWLDIRHVLADKGMDNYWEYSKVNYQSLPGFLNSLKFAGIAFTLLGHGLFFEILYTGLVVYGIVYGLKNYCRNKYGSTFSLFRDESFYKVQYAILVLAMAFVMFLAGFLPMGESRLNAFLALPLAVLLITGTEFLKHSRSRYVNGMGKWLTYIIIMSLAGNILFSDWTIYQERFQDGAYDLKIYRSLQSGIDSAYKLHAPIIALPGIATSDFEKTIKDASYILKAHPAYQVSKPIPVYPALTLEEAYSLLQNLQLRKAVILDGKQVVVKSL
ncbi:MAG TPA: hypothetical protein VHK91_16010 [Flavisolibacter sp.]|nr:hypothetical protein [Flavisolibacter sp.]